MYYNFWTLDVFSKVNCCIRLADTMYLHVPGSIEGKTCDFFLPEACIKEPLLFLHSVFQPPLSTLQCVCWLRHRKSLTAIRKRDKAVTGPALIWRRWLAALPCRAACTAEAANDICSAKTKVQPQRWSDGQSHREVFLSASAILCLSWPVHPQ